MERLMNAILIHLKGHRFADFETFDITSKRIVTNSKAIFIAESSQSKDHLDIKIHTIPLDSSQITSHSIQLLSNSNQTFDISSTFSATCTLEVFKHQSSQIICILVRSTPNKSKIEQVSEQYALSADYVFVSSFTQNAQFPVRFYHLQLKIQRIIRIQFVPKSDSKLAVLHPNNILEIYDVWDNLNQPAKTIHLLKGESNSPISDIYLHHSQSVSNHIITTVKGQIFSFSPDSFQPHQTTKCYAQSKLLYSSVPNSIYNYTLLFKISNRYIYLNSSFTQHNCTLRLFTIINDGLRFISEQSLEMTTEIENRKRHCPPTVIWNDDSSYLFLISNSVVLIQSVSQEVSKLQLRSEVILQIKQPKRCVLLSEFLGELFLIMVSESIKIQTIPIKLKLDQINKRRVVNAKQSQYGDSMNNASKCINSRLQALKALRSKVNRNIPGASTKEQLKQQCIQILNQSRLEFKKCYNLGTEIMCKTRDYMEYSTDKQGEQSKWQDNVKECLGQLGQKLSVMEKVRFVSNSKQKITEQVLQIQGTRREIDILCCSREGLDESISDAVQQHQGKIYDLLK